MAIRMPPPTVSPAVPPGILKPEKEYVDRACVLPLIEIDARGTPGMSDENCAAAGAARAASPIAASTTRCVTEPPEWFLTCFSLAAFVA